MYLKRLEIHGFKSFAATTDFQFGTGVTCVVGPNGSGKTNVADAVRWVLGEQASKIIRARKTEDIIFSGSAKKPALGMADVRLTLDNADGWLPLDFEEVVVSRRAYRSGENEYYINGARVRLKDVTELFLKAQVGQNSYAFMGQGLVEEVLTLRAEERRSLIEEAADVRLHRAKLDDARSKLSSTQDNLDRISMLVSELAPRIRQLERQAGRAEIHARLSTELAQVLRDWYGEQWQEAQESLAASRAVCDQRQEEAEHARSEAARCEEALTALGPETDERRLEIARRADALRGLEDSLRDLERRIASDNERQEMFAARRSEISVEIDQMQAERHQLIALITKQAERVAGLEQSIADANQEQDTESHIDDRQRLIAIRSELSIAEQAATAAAQRHAEAEGRLLAAHDTLQRLNAEADAIDASRSGQRSLLKDWALELAAQQERLAPIRAAAKNADRAATEAQERLERASAAVRRRQDQVRTLEAEADAARIRLEAAQEGSSGLPENDAGVRGILAAGGRIADEATPSEDQIRGVVSMVGELIRVPPGLERAIEAALADSLHAVVVETQEDALAAVELLVQGDLGRATVYPLSDIKAAQPLNLLEEKGIVGVAADLVRSDTKFRPLVNLLLGRTIVVENLGIGKAVLRRGMGSVVTRDGVFLRTTGGVSAGSAKAVRRAFEHKRDVGELPRELERLQNSIADTRAALQREEDVLRDSTQAQSEAAAELERRNKELAAADVDLREHQRRLGNISAQLVALRARLQTTAEALAVARPALEQAEHEAVIAREGSQSTAGELASLVEQERALAASIEDRSNSVQARKLAALDAEREALEQLQAGQASTLARIEQELHDRVQSAARLDADLHNLAERLAAAREEHSPQAAAIEAARKELGPAQHSLEQVESRLRGMNQELAAARSRVLEAERSLIEAEASVQLHSEELEALRQRLEEEGFAMSDAGEVVALSEPDEPPEWLASEPTVVESQTGDEHEAPTLPPMRGGSGTDSTALRERVHELRTQIRRLGPVNEQAETDYAESKERYDYLSTQLTDLQEAQSQLLAAIGELEAIIRERFSTTFQKVNTEFGRYFQTFFGGGQAELMLTSPDEGGLPGIEIVAQPPRKRVRSLHMLSGGERSLTAVALLFALLQTNPSPICVLDEVDAALDEANVDRFTQTLRDLAEKTQFIIITHNRRTIEMADTIYGVSMGEDSTSTVLSLRLSDIHLN
jgi:chromosome segregation protein